MSTYKELFRVTNEPVSYEPVVLDTMTGILYHRIETLEAKLDQVLALLERPMHIKVEEIKYNSPGL
jgi:hypothetical protein